jgi:integrase
MCSVKESDKYIVQVSITVHDPVGEPIRSRSTITLPEKINTDKKADRQLNCIEKAVQEEIHRRFVSMEHHDFISTMEAWLKELRNMIGTANARVNENTMDGYESRYATIKRYFEPLHLSIEQIKPVHIVAFNEWGLREGRIKPLKNGETGLSKRTVSDLHGLLYNFFNDAVKHGVIEVNPCATTAVSCKKKNHVEEDSVIWLTVESYNQFIEWMENEGEESIFHKLIPIVKMTIRYGLRREELLALRWDAVSSDGHIEIKRTRVKGKKVYDLENVKSDASHRKYPISNEVDAILREIKKEQKKLKIYKNDGYIFCWDDGVPYRPDYLSRLFKKAVTRCPYVSDKLHFHSLRHSCCIILAE